jgi:hypothetical protein
MLLLLPQLQESGECVLPDSSNLDSAAVHPDHPEGTYAVNLANGSEVVAALMLIRLDNECPEGPWKLMQNIKLNGVPMTAAACVGWPERLPAAGLLECDFVRVVGSTAKAVLDAKKVNSIERNFKQTTTTDVAMVKTLLTLAPYSYLYASQIARLLKHISTGDQLVRTACALFTRCIDLEQGGYEIMLSSISPRDVHFVQATLGMQACFKGCNPSGHYVLNLSIVSNKMLAIRLRDCAYDEGPSALTWRNIMCATSCYPASSAPCARLQLRLSCSCLCCVEEQVDVPRTTGSAHSTHPESRLTSDELCGLWNHPCQDSTSSRHQPHPKQQAAAGIVHSRAQEWRLAVGAQLYLHIDIALVHLCTHGCALYLEPQSWCGSGMSARRISTVFTVALGRPANGPRSFPAQAV